MLHSEANDERIAYSSNAHFLRNVRLLIDVDLVETDVVDVIRMFLENGRDDTAGAAPRCPKVDHYDLIAVDLRRSNQLSLEVSVAYIVRGIDMAM